LSFGKGGDNFIYIMETINQAIFVKSYRDLIKKIKAYRELDKTIVLTQGTWDMYHTGHIKYLDLAQKMGDILIVAVDTDELVKMRKGPERPFDNFFERVEAVRSHWGVDIVTIKDSKNDKAHLIKLINPDVFVISQSTGPEIQKDLKMFGKLSKKVVNLKPQGSTSTTAKLRRMKSDSFKEFRQKINEALGTFQEQIDSIESPKKKRTKIKTK
jgi:D-glycero-beta-D-manno-heptose 1-phosphate adenylyltransferase